MNYEEEKDEEENDNKTKKRKMCLPFWGSKMRLRASSGSTIAEKHRRQLKNFY